MPPGKDALSQAVWRNIHQTALHCMQHASTGSHTTAAQEVIESLQSSEMR